MKVRVAQTNLTCTECKRAIKVGHMYVWRQRTAKHPVDGDTIYMERVHPECEEKLDE